MRREVCPPLLPPQRVLLGFLCGAQHFSREAHVCLHIWSGRPRPCGWSVPLMWGTAAAVFTARPPRLGPHAPQLCYILDSLLKPHFYLSFPHVFLEYCSVQGRSYISEPGVLPFLQKENMWSPGHDMPASSGSLLALLLRSAQTRVHTQVTLLLGRAPRMLSGLLLVWLC